MAEVVIILDESKVQQVLETVHGVLKNQIGIVTLDDVSVLRPDNF